MEKVKIVICAGTTCYLMGAANLQMLEDHLDPELRDMVEIEGSRCLGYCKNDHYADAPCVSINGEVMSPSSLPQILERIRFLVDGV